MAQHDSEIVDRALLLNAVAMPTRRNYGTEGKTAHSNKTRMPSDVEKK